MPNWNDVLAEITSEKSEHAQLSAGAVDNVRRRYLKKLHGATGRNLIAYYSGFLSKPGIEQSSINDEDKNAFMMAIHKMDRTKGLDIIIHTQGGSVAAVESIVNYLRQMFGKDIRAIVPQIAMSAGTMLACSCKEILVAKHSNLGPIDPWLLGVPASGVISEFERAYKEVKEDPAKITVWQPIISQYRPTFLSQCENVVGWAKSFVTRQLQDVMFEGDPDALMKAEAIVEALSDYKSNRAHERHIHYDEALATGLKVKLLEDTESQEFQDMLLTVHHCYMHSLMNTPAFKMIENQNGVAFVRQQQVVRA